MLKDCWTYHEPSLYPKSIVQRFFFFVNRLRSLLDFRWYCDRRWKTPSSIHADLTDHSNQRTRVSRKWDFNEEISRRADLDQFCHGDHRHPSDDGWWTLCRIFTTDGWYRFTWFLSRCFWADQRPGDGANLFQWLVWNAFIAKFVSIVDPAFSRKCHFFLI